MLLILSVRSAGSEFQIVGMERRGRTRGGRKQWPQHREADNGRWSGDDVMTFGIEVGRIGT